ncbi:MAG: hypothetical protein ACJ71F_14680 [Nitrososphaeraceae archaeon]
MIINAFELSEQDVILAEENGGNTCLWNEVESIRLAEMNWIVEGERSFLITNKLVATLTRPIDEDSCLLGILATSDAVATDIFRTIYSRISEEDMETHNGLILSSSVVTNLRDDSISLIENISVSYLENSPF